MNKFTWYFEWKIIKLKDKLRYWKWTKLEKVLYFKKCSCGHPLWCHQCYQHGTCIHGVCLAETFLDETCCCEGFNDMWNKEYPPNKPELRMTNTQESQQ